MIDRTHPLPLARQAKVAGISRGTEYYLPRPVGETDLVLMRCAGQVQFPAVRAPTGGRLIRRPNAALPGIEP